MVTDTIKLKQTQVNIIRFSSASLHKVDNKITLNEACISTVTLQPKKPPFIGFKCFKGGSILRFSK
jgi:hypothetical protein